MIAEMVRAEARRPGHHRDGTRTGTGLGTFIYAAPEALHAAAEVEAPADVYGLGMTTAFVLHGQALPPVVMRGAPGFAAQLDVPAPWRAAIAGAVEWEIQDRWPSIEAFCQALDDALEEQKAVAVESRQSTVSAEAPDQSSEPIDESKRASQPGEIETRSAEKVRTRRPLAENYRPLKHRPRSRVHAARSWVAAVTVVSVVVWIIALWQSSDSPPDFSRGKDMTAEETPASLAWREDSTAVTTPALERWTIPDLGMEFVYIEPGEFLMGSPGSEEGRGQWETQHSVTFTRGFWMATKEVTQRQFAKFVDATRYKTTAEIEDSSRVWQDSGGSDHPVVHVSWYDAVAFAKWLSGEVESEVRLPTEAEWEYAARAGTKTARYSPNLDEIAWYIENSGRASHPVGEKTPNPWGLYDMLGSVWEWVSDRWVADLGKGSVTDPQGPKKGAERVMRGGSWLAQAPYVRAAFRSRHRPSNRFRHLGFRVSRGQGRPVKATEPTKTDQRPGESPARDEPATPRRRPVENSGVSEPLE